MRGQRRAQHSMQLLDRRGFVAGVRKHGAGQIAEHGVEVRFVGELQRKQKLAIRHEAGFYSERRSKSTRAYRQSASICIRSASSDSNARSSRIRYPNPIRIESP